MDLARSSLLFFFYEYGRYLPRYLNRESVGTENATRESTIVAQSKKEARPKRSTLFDSVGNCSNFVFRL